MPIFELQVTWRSLATVYVEAVDDTQAKQLFEQSSYLPDADEINAEEVLSVSLADPRVLPAPGEVLTRASLD